MAPAGEIWSVVTLSPKSARILALTMSLSSFSSFSKKGGCLIYVLEAFHL